VVAGQLSPAGRKCNAANPAAPGRSAQLVGHPGTGDEEPVKPEQTRQENRCGPPVGFGCNRAGTAAQEHGPGHASQKNAGDDIGNVMLLGEHRRNGDKRGPDAGGESHAPVYVPAGQGRHEHGRNVKGRKTVARWIGVVDALQEPDEKACSTDLIGPRGNGRIHQKADIPDTPPHQPSQEGATDVLLLTHDEQGQERAEQVGKIDHRPGRLHGHHPVQGQFRRVQRSFICHRGDDEVKRHEQHHRDGGHDHARAQRIGPGQHRPGHAPGGAICLGGSYQLYHGKRRTGRRRRRPLKVCCRPRPTARRSPPCSRPRRGAAAWCSGVQPMASRSLDLA